MQIKASTRELARENDHAVNPVRRVDAVAMGSSPQENSCRVSPSRTRVVSGCGSVRETETDFGACAVRRGRGTDQFAAAVAWLLPIGPAGGERGKPWGPCPSVSKARTRLLPVGPSGLLRSEPSAVPFKAAFRAAWRPVPAVSQNEPASCARALPCSAAGPLRSSIGARTLKGPACAGSLRPHPRDSRQGPVRSRG